MIPLWSEELCALSEHHETPTIRHKSSYNELLRGLLGHYDISEYMILEDADVRKRWWKILLHLRTCTRKIATLTCKSSLNVNYFAQERSVIGRKLSGIREWNIIEYSKRGTVQRSSQITHLCFGWSLSKDGVSIKIYKNMLQFRLSLTNYFIFNVNVSLNLLYP